MTNLGSSRLIKLIALAAFLLVTSLLKTRIATGYATMRSPGVEIGPNHIQSAEPGLVVTYRHTLTNTGSTTDTFLVEAASTQHWPVELSGKGAPQSTTRLPLQVGAEMTATFQVSLTVPPGVSGVTEITVITATSRLSPTVRATAFDTTIVVCRLYLPLVVRHRVSAPPLPSGIIVIETDNPNVGLDGDCSLIEALVNANSDARTYVDCPSGEGEVTIVLSANTVYTLTAVGLPGIVSPIVIDGNGATVARDTAPDTPEFGIFSVFQSGALTLTDLTVRGGKVPSDGGGIYNSGSVIVNDGRIVSNTAQSSGGGICNLGILTVTNTTVSGNSAHFGGGIYNGANQYAYGRSGSVEIGASTISSNTAVCCGAGIYNQGSIRSGFGSVTVNNSTLSGNGVGGSGVGIENWGSLRVNNSTVIDNGSGIWTESTYANTEMGNSILDHCQGEVVSTGYNLVQDTRCWISGDTTGNISGQDPFLGPLGDNGGGTETHALLPGSVAIDAGDPGFAGPGHFDQRGPGFPRVAGGRIDIGAFESQP